jgi:hypothetical protein
MATSLAFEEDMRRNERNEDQEDEEEPEDKKDDIKEIETLHNERIYFSLAISTSLVILLVCILKFYLIWK